VHTNAYLIQLQLQIFDNLVALDIEHGITWPSCDLSCAPCGRWHGPGTDK